MTERERTAIVGKHLLDETAEFRMPRTGRHAADDQGDRDNTGELEETQRFDPGFRQQPPTPGFHKDSEPR